MEFHVRIRPGDGGDMDTRYFIARVRRIAGVREPNQAPAGPSVQSRMSSGPGPTK
jgi:hypothetical protein